MIHVLELQWWELDPKLFIKSWIIFVHILGEVSWTETPYSLLHDNFVRLMTKEVDQ